VLQLLPLGLWRAPTTRKVLSVAGAAGEKDEDDEAAEVAAAGADQSKLVPTGRVVAIIQRNLRPYVATLQVESAGGDFSLVVPMNEVIPKIRIRTHQVSALANQRLLVQIDGWDVASKYPSGVYLHSLGPIGDTETGIRCILSEFGISHPPFSINMLRCLPAREALPEVLDKKHQVGSGFHARGARTPFTWIIPDEAMTGRRDLRQSHRDAVCSIDPIGCEDIDDALSCRTLANGNVEIGVHIADVSFFVPAGSLLDQEAARRGTSVYLVDRRLDMLPSILSSDLCSLRGGCDRLCVSVLWEFAPSGQVVATWFGRTAIYNSFALSYEEAQLIFDTIGGTQPVPNLPDTHPNFHLTLEERYGSALRSSLTPAERVNLYPRIVSLLTLARVLRQKRLDVGALELDSLNTKFRLAEDKTVLGVEAEADLEVHATIAEWMVFANSTVAYHIYQAFPQAALLRHHPYPAPQRFDKMRELAAHLGLEIDVSSNKALAASLSRAEELVRGRDFASDSSVARMIPDTALDSNQSKSWIMKLLKELAARAMSEAQYFSTGSVEHVREFFHYGLSADFYTHFTSPIRRYSDLVVHRQILAVIDQEARAKQIAKAEQKALKAEARGEVMTVVPAPASSSSAGPVLFTNETLSKLAHHLNTKNRCAKLAGAESQTLFLASFLGGGPGGRPKVERVEGLVVGLRANGLIVLLPKYHVKGALILVDRTGLANVAHPLDNAFPEEEKEGEGRANTAPRAKVDFDEKRQELVFTLSSPLPPPRTAPKDLATPLPLAHTFHMFDPLVVEVTLRPNLSRYRTPKPVFRLVWHATELDGGRATSTKPAAGAESSFPSSSSSTSVHAASPFSSGPQAPAGAKRSKHVVDQGLRDRDSLYERIRAAVEAKPSARVKAEVVEEKETKSVPAVDRKLQVSATRAQRAHEPPFDHTCSDVDRSSLSVLSCSVCCIFALSLAPLRVFVSVTVAHSVVVCSSHLKAARFQRR
jgi:exoribonuclease R